MRDIYADGTPGVVTDHDGELECDVAIVGSGMGGGTLAWALRDSGARVLILERGDFLPRERENSSPYAVHRRHRYQNSDPWLDAGSGRSFVPGNYHYVGGNTKLYGAALLRLRESDFGEVRHRDGISPAWPLGYDELEPHYSAAEQLYGVHGGEGDPTAPRRSAPYPFPAVPDDPPVAALRARLRAQGLNPFALPLALDWREQGRCVRCGTCDSYPCAFDAKGDADVLAVRPALRHANVKLLTNANVLALDTDATGGTVTALRARTPAGELTVRGRSYVLAAGAVNTAALLLRSRTAGAPDGVANSSGAVGKHYMAHVSSFLLAARPGRDPHLVFEKTIGINDWYEAGPDHEFPLGNVQSLGRLYADTVKPARAWVPLAILDAIVRRGVGFYVETEDLPLASNQVTIARDGRVRLAWRPTNMASHRELAGRMARALRRSGYPLVFTQTLGIEATAHQCGTVRMGAEPTSSALDRYCRSHDVENLWVLDASVFPSSAAVNPALTVAALALRAARRGDITA